MNWIETAIENLRASGFEASAKEAAAEYRRLIAENESLQLALRFYANGNNWLKQDGYCPINADCGAKARITLAAFNGS